MPSDNDNYLPLFIRKRMQREIRNWLRKPPRPGHVLYLTMAFNGSTRVQRAAADRAQRVRGERSLSDDARQRLNKCNQTQSKRIDLGYAKRPMCQEHLEGIVNLFRNMIDRYNLGPRFHKKPVEERCAILAFAENRETNWHFEVLLLVPCVRRGKSLDDVIAVAQHKWRKLTKSGTLNVEKHIRDPEAVRIYVTKQLGRIGALDAFIPRGVWHAPTDEN